MAIFGYPTQCSVCCKPYYGNRDCYGILCAHSPCLHVMSVYFLIVSLGDRNQRAKTALCTMWTFVFRLTICTFAFGNAMDCNISILVPCVAHYGCITFRCTWPWLSLAIVSILRSLESNHTNQLCSISHCDSNSLFNE
ncbi:hypothetical protein V8G54_001989, partial [Vigna mungo]